jgi:hypothetical protein
MSEIFLTHMSWGNDAPDDANRFHETALREARVATEHRELAPAAFAPSSFVTRLRLAFVGGPAATSAACTCPA